MRVAVRVEFVLEVADVMSGVETMETLIRAMPVQLENRLLSATPIGPVIHHRVVTEQLATTEKIG